MRKHKAQEDGEGCGGEDKVAKRQTVGFMNQGSGDTRSSHILAIPKGHACTSRAVETFPNGRRITAIDGTPPRARLDTRVGGGTRLPIRFVICFVQNPHTTLATWTLAWRVCGLWGRQRLC